jgi:L-threonine kinase
MRSMIAVALPATCGELVQGTLDGIPCLVSCPIDLCSVAQVWLSPTPGWQVPHCAPKAVAALHAGLAHLDGMGWGGRLRLLVDLPRGRGYGSSTADIGATLFALSHALGKTMSPDQVARLAVEVEPSDSSIFPGLTLFDHQGGRFFESLGPAPPLTLVVIDPGGEVDTLAFNRIDHREALRRMANQHRETIDMLRQGLNSGDWEAVGEAATLSARLHQTILPNPLFEPVLALAQRVKVLGVCRAHSGTLLGLLLDARHTDLSEVVTLADRHMPASVSVTPYSLIGGGPRRLVDVDHLAGRYEIGIKPALTQ